MDSRNTEKIPLSAGLLAHVDAGKTTLSEALLYESGARRCLGRVDHADAFLDTHALERSRGITIFSKQARLETAHRAITLLDTPGHVDFSPETERVLPVLDCAILVISGTSGVQAHTLTLWELLKKYRVPTFLFISKMDQSQQPVPVILEELSRLLGPGIVDFSLPEEALWEQAALCDEATLEAYLEQGSLTDTDLQSLITRRKLFPCCFGSGLRLEGVDRLLELLDRLGPCPPQGAEFGARVYKISRDSQGNRLTWMRITGGCLKVRTPLLTGADTEKPQQLRLYSGEKFSLAEQIGPGEFCAATGLTATFAGQGLGAEATAPACQLEPVMTYRVVLPEDWDATLALPQLRTLEEEEPQLHLLWENEQIFVQIMGRVQLEILRCLVKERFSRDITLDSGKICYKETICNPVEGVGHFEPLRHYAEVHLLLEPLPRGSGLQFATVCPTDVLEPGFQNLVLTHLGERVHRGVRIGAPITDLKITLTAGRAHLKHTEGGDFRQATYRAVRQGLMQAESLILEPIYHFCLTLPTPHIGRAITDIRTMGGEFEPPENLGDTSRLEGTVPASEIGDYAQQAAAYTQGRAQLQLTPGGYAPCHNPDRVAEEAAYDPESDLPHTPDSVFCSHGAGFTVKWDKVPEYMHLESCLKKEAPQIITRNLRLDDKELEAIMEREFGPIRRPQYRVPENRSVKEEIAIAPPRPTLILVDGYNMVFAWESLKEQAKTDLAGARRRLCDLLSSFAGYKSWELVVVFDGYRVSGSPGEKESFHNIQLVYTKEGQTADAYIQEFASRVGRNYAVKVATSDAMIQLSSLGSGVLRMSARELEQEVENARVQMRRHFHSPN